MLSAADGLWRWRAAGGESTPLVTSISPLYKPVGDSCGSSRRGASGGGPAAVAATPSVALTAAATSTGASTEGLTDTEGPRSVQHATPPAVRGTGRRGPTLTSISPIRLSFDAGDSASPSPAPIAGPADRTTTTTTTVAVVARGPGARRALTASLAQLYASAILDLEGADRQRVVRAEQSMRTALVGAEVSGRRSVGVASRFFELLALVSAEARGRARLENLYRASWEAVVFTVRRWSAQRPGGCLPIQPPSRGGAVALCRGARARGAGSGGRAPVLLPPPLPGLCDGEGAGADEVEEAASQARPRVLPYRLREVWPAAEYEDESPSVLPWCSGAHPGQ